MVRSKVHRVENPDDLMIHYRLIPYDEMIPLLKKDGVVFLEGPFKRQTIWQAARRLSEKVGRKVTASACLLPLKSGEKLQGYVFALEEKESQQP